MTRTLFFFTALFGMLFAMTAILIRVELAYPGISPLYFTPTDGANFEATTVFHGIFGYLFAILLGTTMSAAARRKGAILAGIWMWIGILITIVTVVAVIAGEFALTIDQGGGVGWVLYPPLATTQNPFDGLLAELWPEAPVQDATRLLFVPAASLLVIGASMMVATIPKLGWLSALATVLVILVAVLAMPQVVYGAPMLYVPFYAIAILPLLAAAAVRLSDDAPPSWLMLLTLGLIATLVGLIANSTIPLFSIGDTSAEIAVLYIFPLGWCAFALPALILYTRDTALAPWGLGAVFGALTLTMGQWIYAWVQLGLAGQPIRYVDFPDTFAATNLTVTTSVLAFAVTMLGCVIAARRAR